MSYLPWLYHAALAWAAWTALKLLHSASQDLCRGNPYARPEDDDDVC
jgi:hypothetical protein